MAVTSTGNESGILRSLADDPMALLAAAQTESQSLTGVEGLYSYQYSVAIFVFLVIGLIIFTGIMYLYWRNSKTTIKRGEMVMFGAIFMGVVFAFVFGYIQLVEGYLF